MPVTKNLIIEYCTDYENCSGYSWDDLAEIERFRADIGSCYDGYTLNMSWYSDIKRAMKAYNRYNFTPEEILLVSPNHKELLESDRKFKEMAAAQPEDSYILVWRAKPPYVKSKDYKEQIADRLTKEVG